jgi:hypothetical protein
MENKPGLKGTQGPFIHHPQVIRLPRPESFCNSDSDMDDDSYLLVDNRIDIYDENDEHSVSCTFSFRIAGISYKDEIWKS